MHTIGAYIQTHLALRHPEGVALLLVYDLPNFPVPGVGIVIQRNRGAEHVAPHLVQLLALLEELLGALVGGPKEINRRNKKETSRSRALTSVNLVSTV